MFLDIVARDINRDAPIDFVGSVFEPRVYLKVLWCVTKTVGERISPAVEVNILFVGRDRGVYN